MQPLSDFPKDTLKNIRFILTDIDDTFYCESNEVDCHGVLCGSAIEDNCHTCDDNTDNDCVQDCAG